MNCEYCGETTEFTNKVCGVRADWGYCLEPNRRQRPRPPRKFQLFVGGVSYTALYGYYMPLSFDSDEWIDV